jgi:hypothetical protein
MPRNYAAIRPPASGDLQQDCEPAAVENGRFQRRQRLTVRPTIFKAKPRWNFPAGFLFRTEQLKLKLLISISVSTANIGNTI